MKRTDTLGKIRILLTVAAAALILAFISPAGMRMRTYAAGQNQTVKTGFVKQGSRMYYYGSDHRKKTGWITVNGRIYFAKLRKPYKGSLLTGWQTIGGKEYYFRKKGKAGLLGMAYAGRVRKVNGISCVFNDKGVFTGCKYAGSRSGFIGTIGEMARNNQRKNNILATVVVAQACLETGYGKYIYHNNLFGIYGGRYSSWQGSMEGYNAYIRRYFPSLIGCRNHYTYVNRIASGGYAAAGNYGSSLRWIISSFNLTRFAR